MFRKIATFFGLGLLAVIAFKYYDYTTIDNYMTDSCQFGTYAPLRNIIKIRKENTFQFCSCLGSKFQKNVGFPKSAFISNKGFEDAVLNSAYQCRRAIQGN